MADKQAFEGLTGADLRKAYETLKKVHETKFIAGDNLKKRIIKDKINNIFFIEFLHF